MFKVGIAGAATYATWYDIFSAAVAVYTKCGVNDKAGKGYVLESKIEMSSRVSIGMLTSERWAAEVFG